MTLQLVFYSIGKRKRPERFILPKCADGFRRSKNKKSFKDDKERANKRCLCKQSFFSLVVDLQFFMLSKYMFEVFIYQGSL